MPAICHFCPGQQPLLRGATASGPELSTAGNSAKVSSCSLLGTPTITSWVRELYGQGPVCSSSPQCTLSMVLSCWEAHCCGPLDCRFCSGRQPLLRGATASGPQLSTAGNSTRVSSHLLLGGHTCNPELGQGPLWSGFQCSAPLLTALSQRCSPVGRLAFGTPPPVCPLPLYGLMAPMLNPAVTSGVSSTPMVCGSCWCGYCKRFF